MPGFSGCLEHNSVITEIIREAKEDKGNLAIVWLDLANAYGSVPHQLIERAMVQYHIPNKIQDIIIRYYSNIKVHFTTGTFTTKYQQLEKGIVTGCTVSVILFVMAINLIINIAEKEGQGSVSRSGIRQPSIRAFMDNMKVMTTRGMSVHWIIRKLNKTIEWAGMKFKPRKSRSVVIVKGKIESRYCFRIQGTNIPTIKDSAIKCLSKWYNETLKDSENVKRFKQQVSSGLAKIERSLLTGKYKL